MKICHKSPPVGKEAIESSGGTAHHVLHQQVEDREGNPQRTPLQSSPHGALQPFSNIHASGLAGHPGVDRGFPRI